MTNAGYTDISQYRDVESINHFRILQEKGLSEADAYRILQIHSRDSGRTPMQWTDGENAGFTDGAPWIEVNKNCDRINAAQQLSDEDSIFHYYRKLVELRKTYDVIAMGDVEPMARRDPAVFAYRRTWEDEELLVICNFYGRDVTWDGDGACSPKTLYEDGYERLLGNYEDWREEGDIFALRPYEAIVLYRKKK